LFIGFDRPVAGREAEAFALFGPETFAQLDTFVKEGFCEDYEVIGLTPHCGSLNSMLLLKGERAKLDELRRTDHFERFSLRSARLFTGYGVVPGLTLEGLRKAMERTSDLMR
jgi:hypothetical protein